MAHRSRRRIALALVAAAGACAPAPALAADVSVRQECDSFGKGCAYYDLAVFQAQPGEANDVVATLADGVLVVRDRVPLRAGKGCTQVTPTEASCKTDAMSLLLGDGNDAATTQSPGRLPIGVLTGLVDGEGGDDRVTGSGSRLAGGDGDDTLTGELLDGGPGRDSLTGTDGADSLTGGPGEDSLAGGAGDDQLTGDGDGTRSADVLDGGPGTDTVSYARHTAAVVVDIARQVGGAEAEGDRISGFEHADGGEGDDVLSGDGGPNRLFGDMGANTITGGTGDDQLRTYGSSTIDGGEGDDLVHGGFEDDVLEGGPGADVVTGGFGLDRFSGGDGDDVLEVGLAAATGLRREPLSCGDGRAGRGGLAIGSAGSRWILDWSRAATLGG